MMMTKPNNFLFAIDVMNKRSVKWILAFGMVATTALQLGITHWLKPVEFTHGMMGISDTGILLALFTVLFLGFSVTKPVLRYASANANVVSHNVTGNIYFVCGCVCFVLFQIF